LATKYTQQAAGRNVGPVADSILKAKNSKKKSCAAATTNDSSEKRFFSSVENQLCSKFLDLYELPRDEIICCSPFIIVYE
jgi:hypothetical protein